MKNTRIAALRRGWREVKVVEPNDLGIPFLNPLYRRGIVWVKSAPFIIIIPLAFTFFIALAVLSRFFIVRLATFIQYGF
jgi:hypothetical protein